MRRISRLLTALLAMLIALTSCGGKDSQEEETTPENTIVKTIPENGSTVSGEVQISVEFSLPVKITSGKAVTINGNTKVGNYNISYLPNGKSLVISPKITAQAGQKYDVVIPAGTVKDYNQEIRFSFQGPEPSTKPQPGDRPKTLVNGNATAQKLFDYLNGIYGKQMLSGAMSNVSWEQSEAQMVKDLTGKTPATYTIDYIHLQYSWLTKGYYTDLSAYEDHASKNGLVAASWHMMVPTSEADVSKESAWAYKTTGFKPSKAITDGTWENKFLNKMLDDCANKLLLFKDKDIPVIWRPLHEASGAWFWWGQENAESYKKLWAYMFNYFKDKGLDNLIWVWTTQVGVGQWDSSDDSQWYPGDEYVDIIARDMYNKAKSSDCIAEYGKIEGVFPNKMIALGENGNIAKISDIYNGGGKFLYFMPWYTYNLADLDKSEHANKAWWLDAAKCESVLFLEDLPNWRE